MFPIQTTPAAVETFYLPTIQFNFPKKLPYDMMKCKSQKFCSFIWKMHKELRFFICPPGITSLRSRFFAPGLKTFFFHYRPNAVYQ